MTALDEIVGFARALRGAGLPIGVDQTEACARAIGWLDPLGRRELYLAARATLVTRGEDRAVFDALFAAHFGDPGLPRAAPAGQAAPRAPRHDQPATRSVLGSYLAERVDPDARELPDRARAASAGEALQRKDFAACTPAELEAIARAIGALRFELTLRRSRRRVRARRGEHLDLRRILRGAARHGGAVLALARHTRKSTRRPLVVLADISGSMELYARIVLQLLHGVTQRHARTETFVFGTRLTRITRELQIRRVDTALDQAARQIVDFAGGTRIGDCLAAFDRAHARRVLGRGAVVLVISDGWDTGEPARLADEVRRIADRAHRVVWCNPLLGHAGYAPLVRGMAAALAHVDDFLPIHDLRAVGQLAAHLGRLPSRRPHRRFTRPPGAPRKPA